MYGTLLANAILGIIVIVLYPILIKMNLKKHPSLHIPYKREEHLLASIFPKNTALIMIINFLLCFIVSTLLTMGILGCCFLNEINVAVGAITRGFDCVLFSIMAYYLCAVFTPSIVTASPQKE